MLAIDFAKKHDSCIEAIIWRESLGPTATQSDAYAVCPCGDWMIWQLSRLPKKEYEKIKNKRDQALEIFIKRAIKNSLKLLKDNTDPWAVDCKTWAYDWLTGKDRSEESAWDAMFKPDGQAFAVKWAARGLSRAAKAAKGFALRDAACVVSRDAANAACYTANDQKSEQLYQAQIIRDLIPVWPGE